MARIEAQLKSELNVVLLDLSVGSIASSDWEIIRLLFGNLFWNWFSGNERQSNFERVCEKCGIFDKLTIKTCGSNRPRCNTPIPTNATTYFISDQSNYTILLIRLLFACNFHLQWNWNERIDLAKQGISARNSSKCTSSSEIDRCFVRFYFDFLPSCQNPTALCAGLIMFTRIYVVSEWVTVAAFDAGYSHTIQMRWANDLVQRNNVPFGNVYQSTLWCLTYK